MCAPAHAPICAASYVHGILTEAHELAIHLRVLCVQKNFHPSVKGSRLIRIVADNLQVPSILFPAVLKYAFIY